MAKIKLATTWLEACSGCHMSFLDIDERIIELLQHVELTSSPITDLKHPPESGVDVGIVTGGIGNVDELEEVKMMRERCKFLIALGDCAVTGGICTMRNSVRQGRRYCARGYIETVSTVDGSRPGSEDLPELTENVMALDQVVPGGPLSLRLPPQCRPHLVCTQRVDRRPDAQGRG